MLKSNSILHSFLRLLIAVMLIIFASIASADGPDFVPFNGLWVIDEENNGKPGRGFQIDVQNGVLVLYFYGYDDTGAEKWWLAAGSFKPGSNEITMGLQVYEDGMSFGAPPGNATYLGTEGELTIRFSDFDSGEICLPNESCKAISTVNFGVPNSAEALKGMWVGTSISLVSPFVGGFQIIFDKVVASSNPDVIDRISGIYLGSVDGEQTTSFISCQKFVTPKPWEYFCTLDELGSSYEIIFSMNRNAFLGEVRDSFGESTDIFYGYRIFSADDRALLPN